MDSEDVKKFLDYDRALSGVTCARKTDINPMERRYVLCVGAYNSPGKEWLGLAELCKIFGNKPTETYGDVQHLAKSGLLTGIEGIVIEGNVTDRKILEVVGNGRERPLKLTPQGKSYYQCLLGIMEGHHRDFPIDFDPTGM